MPTQPNQQPPVVVQAPTVNQVVAGWLQNAVSHPRTTISGLLTIGLTTIPFLLACNCLSVKVAGFLFTANAICKALWAAFAMRDSGSTLAMVPGQSTPKMTPSHETPNDPQATPAVVVNQSGTIKPKDEDTPR